MQETYSLVDMSLNREQNFVSQTLHSFSHILKKKSSIHVTVTRISNDSFQIYSIPKKGDFFP